MPTFSLSLSLSLCLSVSLSLNLSLLIRHLVLFFFLFLIFQSLSLCLPPSLSLCVCVCVWLSLPFLLFSSLSSFPTFLLSLSDYLLLFFSLSLPFNFSPLPSLHIFSYLLFTSFPLSPIFLSRTANTCIGLSSLRKQLLIWRCKICFPAETKLSSRYLKHDNRCKHF